MHLFTVLCRSGYHAVIDVNDQVFWCSCCSPKFECVCVCVCSSVLTKGRCPNA